MSRDADVIVVGSGNAGFCAALAAAERDARVLLLEKGPVHWLGGNSYFTAGAIRTVHGGLEDLVGLVAGLDPAMAADTDLAPYPRQDFRADMILRHRGASGPGARRAADRRLPRNAVVAGEQGNRAAADVRPAVL